MTYPSSNQKYLDPKTFKCTSCGQCCRPIVLITEEEIKTIESIGMKRKSFIDIDPLNESGTINALKQVNGVCMFLKKDNTNYDDNQNNQNNKTKENNKFICSIYNYRPSICRKYPFFDEEKMTDCHPKRWKYWMDINQLVKR
ncbi:MAG: YkgJ family cysteine cluster protein [Candidatus Woesearchaeota archaeon]